MSGNSKRAPRARTRTTRKPASRPSKVRRPAAPRPTVGLFNAFVADQLDGLGEVEMRAMFGGHGIYLDGKFFGIAHKSRLYFRVGPATIEAYRERGMKEFNPYGKPLTTYYEVPPEVQEERAELKRWAQAAARTIRRAAGARSRTR